MTAEKLIAQTEQRDKDAAAIKKLWVSLLSAGSASIEAPSPAQLHLWLRMFPLDVITYGVHEVAGKWARMNYSMDLGHAIRHASACMHSHKKSLTLRKASYTENVRAL
jgi:hypothetical protein